MFSTLSIICLSHTHTHTTISLKAAHQRALEGKIFCFAFSEKCFNPILMTNLRSTSVSVWRQITTIKGNIRSGISLREVKDLPPPQHITYADDLVLMVNSERVIEEIKEKGTINCKKSMQGCQKKRQPKVWAMYWWYQN